MKVLSNNYHTYLPSKKGRWLDGIAKPLCLRLLANAAVSTRDNVAMLVGMVLFTDLNYLGQRFFAFRSPKTEEK